MGKGIISINERTEVDTMWFGPYPGGDLLGVILRQEGEPWGAILRFRRHRDDEKSVIQVKSRPDDDLITFRALVQDAIDEAAVDFGITKIVRHLIAAKGKPAATALIAALGDNAQTTVIR